MNHLEKREGLRARVETETHPPRSCFIDGIQFASGCTIGKGTLEVRAGSNVSVEFVRGDRSIGLVVRNNILRTLDHLVSKKQLETLSREILERNDDELFLILTD
jgi:formylmethanofuran dehydrogenase subunit E